MIEVDPGGCVGRHNQPTYYWSVPEQERFAATMAYVRHWNLQQESRIGGAQCSVLIALGCSISPCAYGCAAWSDEAIPTCTVDHVPRHVPGHSHADNGCNVSNSAKEHNTGNAVVNHAMSREENCRTYRPAGWVCATLVDLPTDASA
eukprot:COSAG02_NODE_2594_length_8461_cov_189.802320_4_plen_147_part_00